MALDQVITEAKSSYPLEDGWIVINEARMQNLCDICKVNQLASIGETFTPAIVPEGASSLAEAIVIGNTVAAYQMIGNRPMFSLASAAEDINAVYRMRQGVEVSISSMLEESTKELSDADLQNIVKALNGALDGTHDTEEGAVRMSIVNAIKIAS